MDKPTAVVLGVGAEVGVGAAVCRRFAAEGHHVLVAGRTQAKIDQVVDTISQSGGTAEAVLVDGTKQDQVVALFDRAMAPGKGFAPADAAIFNMGNNQFLDFLKVDAAKFEDFWRVGCFAGFLFGQEAARRFMPLERGTVIFTGASGSLRGKAGFAQFAAAKAGLRMISQSMAREFGPGGLHVAHVVVDGGINGERLRNAAPQFIQAKGEDGLLDVDAIAANYWMLHQQPKSAWTQELDLRPYKEVY